MRSMRATTGLLAHDRTSAVRGLGLTDASGEQLSVPPHDLRLSGVSSAGVAGAIRADGQAGPGDEARHTGDGGHRQHQAHG
jgi:hypothetical protein